MSQPEIVITFPGGKKVDAEVNGRVIHTDQSPAAGGEGSAPEPFSLFLAALGTCAGIYVLGFLQSRGLPTEGLRLRQRLTVDPESRLITDVELVIEAPPAVPEKYHAALVRAAEGCAVKKAIQHAPQFHVRVAVPVAAE